MNFIIALALTISSTAHAYRLTYKVKKPNFSAILARVEAQTGLVFEKKCSSCTVNGHITADGTSVIVDVYQVKAAASAVPVKVTTELKKKIGAAVLGL